MPSVTVRPTLSIDTDLFTQQRELLTKLIQVLVDARVTKDGYPITMDSDDLDNLGGLESLCDAIVDCIDDQSSDDRAERERRDEKRGLYSAHEDQSN